MRHQPLLRVRHRRVVVVDPQALFLVHVRLAHNDGDRKGRDVHHHQEGDLYRWMEPAQPGDGEARSAGRGDLEQAVDEFRARGHAGI